MQGPVRFGFTVSKKVGNAVERNRVRRRLKEIVRLSDPNRMHSGHDYVLVGRRAALKLPFDRMTNDFEGALRRAHAGRERQHGIPMTDNKNTILAIVLSAVVLIAWQYFYAMPQAEKQKLAQQQTAGAAAGAEAGRRRRRPQPSPAQPRPRPARRPCPARPHSRPSPPRR